MPWQIKTRLNQALRSILNLIDYPKKMYVSPHLLSTIDYQSLMTDRNIESFTINGTETKYIKCPKKMKMRIVYGRIKYTADANIVNRHPILIIRDINDTETFAWWQPTNAITANQSKWIFLTNQEYEGEGVDSVISPIISQYVTPHWLFEQDQYKLYTSGGVVGDSLEAHIRIEYTPVKEDWQQ